MFAVKRSSLALTLPQKLQVRRASTLVNIIFDACVIGGIYGIMHRIDRVEQTQWDKNQEMRERATDADKRLAKLEKKVETHFDNKEM